MSIKNERLNVLRDKRREIPSLASDFLNDVEVLQGGIELTLQRNVEINSEINCLKEEVRAQEMIAKVEDQRTARNQFELSQLKSRVEQLQEEMEDVLERGDNQYNLIRKEIKEQDDVELLLQEDINNVSNRCNNVLRAKLNENNEDFERLRQLGQEGMLGVGLEEKVTGRD